MTKIAHVAAGVLFGAVTMTSASAQMRAPIVVQSCTILRAQRVYQPYWRFWSPWAPVIARGSPVADGIRIVYENVGRVAADRVAFRVNYRGDEQHIIDVGTFSPQVTINHSFGNFSGDAYLGPQPNRCLAIAARFTDGTVWHRPRP